MERRLPILLGFLCAIRVHNQQGYRLRQNGRESAVLIIPLRGRIRFSQGAHVVVADAATPVYIPRGAAYLNECLEEADSLLFNICDTETVASITPLATVEHERALSLFARVCALQARKSAGGEAETLSLLYRLLSDLYREAPPAREEALLAPALEMIELRYHDPALSLASLAACCHISPAYLGRLFKQTQGKTPFAYLAEVRMERARRLLAERYPVGEVARAVGYGDIYQFSRAFKRCFGRSPHAMAGVK